MCLRVEPGHSRAAFEPQTIRIKFRASLEECLKRLARAHRSLSIHIHLQSFDEKMRARDKRHTFRRDKEVRRPRPSLNSDAWKLRLFIYINIYILDTPATIRRTLLHDLIARSSERLVYIGAGGYHWAFVCFCPCIIADMVQWNLEHFWLLPSLVSADLLLYTLYIIYYIRARDLQGWWIDKEVRITFVVFIFSASARVV